VKALFVAALAAALSAAAPFAVAPGLFDASRPDNLGLAPAPGTQSFVVFRPGPGTDKFANGVVPAAFKGRLYVQWQSSARDEDSPDTHVVYATSADGEHWSRPQALAAAGPAMRSSGGWWTDGETLVAYVNVWPDGFRSGKGGYTEYMTSIDGEHWSAPRRVTGADGKPVDGIIEQDPHRLSSGRIVTAFHMRPGMIVAPFYTDDSLAVSGWRRGRMQNLPHAGTVSREIEPSLFLGGDCLVMVFRDQAESFRVLAAKSCDAGESWTTPTLTDMPDARAKLSAGNLPDGTAFLVNAPSGNKVRMPLAISLARDGAHFTRAFLLRDEASLPALVYPGKYKRLGFHYPKSTLWNGYLYVGYSSNKETVEVTRVPVASLTKRP
jgi:hypothetical protein